MTNYNVWNDEDGSWITDLSSLHIKNQDPAEAQAFSYLEARKVCEWHRAKYPDQNTTVRELLEDNEPGNVVGFNVWMIGAGRWTNSLANLGLSGQDIHDPTPLTFDQAKNLSDSYKGDSREVKEINSDLNPAPLWKPLDKPKEVAKPAPKPEQETPVAKEIDFDIYNGFKAPPPRQAYARLIDIDPYTGLPR